MIRTVLGDIDPAAAGLVDSHDHLFLSTPALPGEALDDEAEAAAQLRSFAGAGGGTIVQWTPRGLGRGLGALRRLSAATGVQVVAATGRHRAALYDGPTPAADRLADAFIEDITANGCGLIKIGTSDGVVTPDEVDALHSAAIAHHATGAPIAVHLEGGSAADLVLDLLLGDGVPAGSIVLGHLGRNPDLARVLDAARSGARLCLDAPSPRHPLDVDGLARLLGALIDDGHLGRLLLGADTTLASARRQPLVYGPAALLGTVLPRLREALGPDSVRRIVSGNPAAAWALRR